VKLRALVGSGHKIGAVVLPVLVVGLALDVAFPDAFDVGGPAPALAALSAVVLAGGLVVWAWSVALILTKVPRGELITGGPYAVVKHPLYTSVALLVLPWLGFLLDTWLGVVLGAALYLGTRVYAPDEERELAATFGQAWDDYCAAVKLSWL
jgi:protein-S-isoprenylcysteine O-methyltransferase Ste14